MLPGPCGQQSVLPWLSCVTWRWRMGGGGGESGPALWTEAWGYRSPWTWGRGSIGESWVGRVLITQHGLQAEAGLMNGLNGKSHLQAEEVW